MVSVPREWIVLDIETAAATRPESIEREVMREWRPDARWKPETIGKRYLEAREKARDRAALLDSADVVVVAVKTSAGEVLVLHGLGESSASPLAGGAVVQGFASPAAMLAAFSAWMGSVSDEQTMLAGHNILGFDLKRLRLAMVRDGVQMPVVLVDPGQPVTDTMRLFVSRFSGTSQMMVSLADACEAVGIEHHKDAVSGAQVGDLIAGGDVATLAAYAAADVTVEARLFEMLTGRARKAVA